MEGRKELGVQENSKKRKKRNFVEFDWKNKYCQNLQKKRQPPKEG